MNYDTKKFLTLIFIIIVSCVVAGLYGIIHDQLTYSISHEYYTKFKFYQFGLADVGDEAIFPNPRVQVSIVGFLATWWTGLLIGLILGLVGLAHKNSAQMFKTTLRSIGMTVLITFITGLIGLLYGKYILALDGVSWWLPENLTDKNNFIAVGSMHNFSYLGGLFGLITGSIYSVRQRKNNMTLEVDAHGSR